MSFYYVVLFFHISGALILFMGLSQEWVGISRLNNAVKPEQAGEWIKFLASLKFAFIIGGTLLLVTGIYLAAARWGWTAWIIVSFILWLFITIHGSVVTGTKVMKFSKFLSSASEITADQLNMHISKLKLMKLLQTRLVIGLGAVFIMTVKPKIAGSIVVVIIAVILGLLPLLTKQKKPASN